MEQQIWHMLLAKKSYKTLSKNIIGECILRSGSFPSFPLSLPFTPRNSLVKQRKRRKVWDEGSVRRATAPFLLKGPKLGGGGGVRRKRFFCYTCWEKEGRGLMFPSFLLVHNHLRLHFFTFLRPVKAAK